MLNRRDLLVFSGVAASLAVTGFSSPALAQQSLKLGSAAAFSFERLKKVAYDLSRSPYKSAPTPSSDILEQIDYDAHGKIKFKPEYALWADGPGKFPVTFFHLGRFFKMPVRMFAVKQDLSREIIYDIDYFDVPENSPAHKLSENTGFAGFRFQEARDGKLDWRKNDWVAFLGASYFRAIGELYQYGLSARGIAVDVAVPDKPEEFPVFTHFYFETPTGESDTVTVYALLDSPSIVGAFRFDMERTNKVLMTVEQTVHLRRDVARLGICPLTSMYWYSETTKQSANDWRPEVHDSDGLALWTGAGERIWRPLNNPPYTITSSFMDENAKGFGLLQRDRHFDHYQDGVRYERRPSLWIEPLGEWGKGSVQLVEIPTDDEIHDNIVAMWVPHETAKAQQSYTYKYRMYWTDEEPFPTPLAHCIGLRFGNGGQAGTTRPHGVRKFVVEFHGKPLETLPSGTIPVADITTSRGQILNVQVEAIPNDISGFWRILFDLKVEKTEPVELRAFLKSDNTILSETWLYQYHPPQI